MGKTEDMEKMVADLINVCVKNPDQERIKSYAKSIVASFSDENLICPYCGCEAGDHPIESIPLGSNTCAGCQDCPLLMGHVIKIAKSG